MTRFLFNDPRVPQFVAESVGSTNTDACASLGLEEDGEIIVGSVMDNYSGANVFLHFSVKPGRAIPRDFLKLLFGYCFDALKVKRVSAAFSSANRKVKRFGEFLGFSLEAVLKDAQPDGDTLIYCLRREQCRFLVNQEVACG